MNRIASTSRHHFHGLIWLLLLSFPVMGSADVQAEKNGAYIPRLKEARPLWMSEYALCAEIQILPDEARVAFRLVNRSPGGMVVDAKTIYPDWIKTGAELYGTALQKDNRTARLVKCLDSNYEYAEGKFTLQRAMFDERRSSGPFDKYILFEKLCSNPAPVMPRMYIGHSYEVPSKMLSYFPRLLERALETDGRAECWVFSGSTSILVSTSPATPPKATQHFYQERVSRGEVCVDTKTGRSPLVPDDVLLTNEIAITPAVAKRFLAAIAQKKQSGAMKSFPAPTDPPSCLLTTERGTQNTVISATPNPFTATLRAEFGKNQLYADITCVKEVLLKTLCDKNGRNTHVPTVDGIPRLHMKTLDLRNWTWGITGAGKPMRDGKFTDANSTSSVEGRTPSEPPWPSVADYEKMPSPAFLCGQLAGRVLTVSEAPFFAALCEFYDAIPSGNKSTATLSIEIPLFMPDKDNKPTASGTLKASIPISRDEVGSCLSSTMKWIAVPLPKDMMPVTGTSMSSKPTATP